MPDITLSDPKPYKTKDGIWVARFYLGYDATGKRITRTVSSKNYKECVQKRNKLRKDLEAGNLTKPSNTTVAQWMDYWIDEIAKERIRPRVWQTYKSTIKVNINPHIGKRKLVELAPADIRTMHRKIAAAGKATKTVEGAYTLLKSALADAVKEGKIDNNVCEKVDRPKASSEVREPLTNLQARKLLRHSIDHNDPMVSRWATAFMTGARQGECLGLRWEYVDFENNLIDFSWQLQDIPKKHGCGEPSPKGAYPCGQSPTRPSKCPIAEWDIQPGFELIELANSRRALVRPKTKKSIRIVPMIEPLAHALKIHKLSSSPNPHDLVWVSPVQGRPIGSRHDKERWNNALESAGLPVFPLHAARHTTATLLLEAGIDPMVIAQILGHASVLTTQRYAHVDQALARAALGKLDNLMEIA